MGFTPTPPMYSGDGLKIWEGIIEKGKNKGKTYLKVCVLGGKSIACFRVEPKEAEEEQEVHEQEAKDI